LSWKKSCSPAVKTKSPPQSAHFNILSWNSMGSPFEAPVLWFRLLLVPPQTTQIALNPGPTSAIPRNQHAEWIGCGYLALTLHSEPKRLPGQGLARQLQVKSATGEIPPQE
jgi:hypothetical protein